MRHLKNRGLWHRIRFAMAGIRHGLSTERSLKTQTLILVVVLIALLMLRPPLVWCALIAITSAAVLAAELFNTAVEQLADRLHPEEHPEIRIVKDCAAGAVLVTSLGAVVVALLFVLEVVAHR